MNFPFDKSVIPQRGPINPMDAMPAEQFGRSIDSFPASPPSSGGGGGIIPPFCLVKVDSTNVKVTFGQINGETPLTMNTNIDVSGADGTHSILLYIDVNDDGSIGSPEVFDNGTGSIPDDAFDFAYMLVGEVDVVDSLITEVRTSLMFSQGFVACGRNPDDPETTPGTYYFFVA